ncbi:MAG: hypothetical protein HFH31_02265 [Bacilli bacterium]|nr:hypothetical protein [Bacilli bacterium]
MNQNLQSILEDSISYFDEIRAFKFSLDKIDISRASEKKIFENLQAAITASSISFPYSKDFKKNSLEENKQLAISFFESFLGENTGTPLTTIPIEKASMPMFDGATLFSYNLQEKTITPIKIVLYRTDLSYNALSLCHENTHILFNNHMPTPGFHYHYNELLPILIELIATTYFSELLNEKKLLDLYLTIRTKTLQDHIAEYKSCEKLLKMGPIKEIELPIKYSMNTCYTYIISTIFAFHLFEQYQKYPDEIRAIIKECLMHHIKVEDMLRKRDISLKNPDTVNATMKVLQKK